ncbi:MAG: hypothetical protein ACQESB_05400 [Elusimicrobiota bacterium]
MPGRAKNKKDSALTKVRGLKIKLRKREILRYLRHSSRAGALSESMEHTLQEEIQNAYSLIYPSVIYKTVFKKNEGYEKIKEILSKNPDKLNQKLSSSEAITLMAATAGSPIDEKIEELKKENLTRAFILDAAASEAAEQSANFVSKIINSQARDMDCYTGDRFSPGYGGWPLEVSAEIAGFLQADKIGIELSGSGTMIPRKSITAAQMWFAL